MTTKISFAIKESILIIIVIKNIKKHSIIWCFISSWKVHEVRLNKRNLSLFYQSCLVFLWHQEKGVRIVLLVLSSMRVYFHGKTLNNIDRNHQDVDQAAVFVKQWFAAGAHCCRLRKTGSVHFHASSPVARNFKLPNHTTPTWQFEVFLYPAPRKYRKP